jgi:hypothetical protein
MEKNNKENIKTEKEGRQVKLTIDNAEVSSNRDIGMNMRQMNHVNSCILWFENYSSLN